MSVPEPLPASVLQRKAVVYVRQSTQVQVETNLESRRRQYELADLARERGFAAVEIIDDDLGRSASGMVARPGFERLVAALCAGEIGAVFCFDASRLARNGRDWHHLLELCGLVEARVIDLDGLSRPLPAERPAALGHEGLDQRVRARRLARAHARRRACQGAPRRAAHQRAHRPRLAPRPRPRARPRPAAARQTIRLIFERFRHLGSARQTLLSLAADGVSFPRPSDGKRLTVLEWTPIRYRNVISLLKNPFYAGAHAYGKSEKRVAPACGRARKTYGHEKSIETWEVLIKEHHEGHIDWAEFERNQATLAANCYGRAGGPKSGRGGRALLAGVLSCGQCGRGLAVSYAGRAPGRPVYRCDRPRLARGAERCMSVSGTRIDAAVVAELARVVEPMAVEAAREAERMHREGEAERQRMVELDLQQALYDASLAERRCAACDPDNRLIAAPLERNWEAALRRVETCRARVEAIAEPKAGAPAPDLDGLAEDLAGAWHAPGVTMRARQQLLRTPVAGHRRRRR